jgi:murein L,D-transpeptidase YafK
MLGHISDRSTALLFISILMAALTGAALAEDTSLPAADRISLTIYKSRHEMHLYRGKDLIKIYRIFLGSSPVGHKVWRGDNKTPEGNYRVVEKRDSDKFYRFIAIDYPNAHDAELAFRQGKITARQKARIRRAIDQGTRPPADTVLGGHLGIHGIGRDEEFKLKLIEDMDWTNGCISVTNNEIHELYREVPMGAVVRIRK